MQGLGFRAWKATACQKADQLFSEVMAARETQATDGDHAADKIPFDRTLIKGYHLLEKFRV